MRKRDRRRNEKTWTIKIDKISRHLVSAVIILLGTVIAQKLWEKYGRAARKRKREREFCVYFSYSSPRECSINPGGSEGGAGRTVY